jgi:8-oxo-dGTP diphosphatase
MPEMYYALGMKRLAVGAVVLRSDGAVLLVQRGEPPARGSWTLPGGKVEPGETPEQAVVRELAEETGLRVAPIAVVETLDLEREGYAYRIVDFACSLVEDGEPRAASDVAAARWVPPSEFATLGLTPEVVRVIALARQIH